MSVADRISDLPDDILCHILSFLPTKVACTTTVLSKRWISLYYSLTSVHFEDQDGRPNVPPSTEVCLRFRRFVDTFMLSFHCPIKTFRLTCRSKLWGENIAPLNADEWVEAAKRHGVQDFHISIQNPLISPELRYVQDRMLIVDNFYEQPRNHPFAYAIEPIKTSLSKRRQLVENLKLSPSIFTCKTLVVLKLSGLIVGSNVNSIDLPSLKTLHMMEVYFSLRKDFMMLLSGCPVLEDLHAPTVNNLQNNLIDGFRNLPNLVKADIRAFHVPFTILYNVQYLRIAWIEHLSCYYMPWFRQNPNQSYYNAIPMFQNLIHIELCNLFYDGLLRFLKHCPKLQILVTKECFDDRVHPTFALAECISLPLRTCSIVNYGGPIDNSYQLEFASYIMKNASHLQVMTIHNPKYCDPKQKLQDLQKFHSLYPNVPPACKFSFSSCSYWADWIYLVNYE